MLDQLRAATDRAVAWKSPLESIDDKAATLAPRVVPLTYTPKQIEFIDSDVFATAFIGGVGAGKSWGLMGWVISKLHAERGSGCVGGIFANTYKQLSQATLPSLWSIMNAVCFEYGRDYVYNERPPRSWGYYASEFKKDFGNVLSVRWWGQAVIRSLEDPNLVRGITIGWAAVDEARDLSEEGYKIVLGRIRSTKAKLRQVKIATTPAGFDWIYERFVDRPTESSRMIHCPTRENTFVPQEYEGTLRENYDELFAKQELDAEFVSLVQGAVYRCFSRATHVTNEVAFNPEREAVVTYDFNRTPFCVLLGQIVGDGHDRELHIIDEVYIMDSDTSGATEEVIAKLKAANMTRVRVYGDPAGNQRTTKNNLSDYDIIAAQMRAEFGGGFTPAWEYAAPPVARSVHAVNGLLKSATGRVRFKVHTRCRYLIRDFMQVKWKIGTKQIDKSGEENKMLTHLSDALRYLVDIEFPLLGTSGAGSLNV